MPCFLCYLQSHFTAVRHMSARCFGVLSQISTQEAMSFVIEKILPLMRASDNDTQRLGASEAVASILYKPLKCQENLHLKMLSVYVVC